MAKFIVSDAIVMLRGLTAVSRAAISVTENELKEAWQYSSILTGLKDVRFDSTSQDIPGLAYETTERAFAVAKGLSEFSSVTLQKLCSTRPCSNTNSTVSDHGNNLGPVTSIGKLF